jgi:hypothetical protein
VEAFLGTSDGKSDPTATIGVVGKMEMKSVGTTVGTLLGKELGTFDGTLDGTLEGTLDGTLLGVVLGTSLGTSLGVVEGTIDVASASNSVPRLFTSDSNPIPAATSYRCCCIAATTGKIMKPTKATVATVNIMAGRFIHNKAMIAMPMASNVSI